MRLYWIQVGLKCIRNVLIKGREDAQRMHWEKGHVKTETEMGVTLSQAKETQKLLWCVQI